MRDIRFCLVLCTLAGVMACGAEMAIGQDTGTISPYARWERSIERFEQADLDDRRPRGGVLFVGSSSIRLWNLKQAFPNLQTVNHGFGGSQIDDTIHFADRIVWPFRPQVIVFYAGDNDMARGKSAAETAGDFARFSDLVRQQLPETSLIYVAIKPSLARWKLADEMKCANDMIAQQCADSAGRIFLDIWTPMLDENGRPRPELFVKDGLHMNAAGYALWNDLLQQELRALVKSPGTSSAE